MRKWWNEKKKPNRTTQNSRSKVPIRCKISRLKNLHSAEIPYDIGDYFMNLALKLPGNMTDEKES